MVHQSPLPAPAPSPPTAPIMSTHPNLSALVADDAEGAALLAEFDENDAEIERELGAAPTDFAFTSTTWSSVAESLVAVSAAQE